MGRKKQRDPDLEGLELDLDLAKNMMGTPIYPIQRRRLIRAYLHASERTWNDVYGIIVSDKPGMGLTMWQAVRVVDPTFPDRKPDNTPWSRWPDQATIRAAIHYATHQREGRG